MSTSTATASRSSVTTTTMTTAPGMRIPRTTVLTLTAATTASGDARKKFGAPPPRPHPSSPPASAPSPSQTSTPVVVVSSPIPASTTRASRASTFSAPPNAPTAPVLPDDASPSTVPSAHTRTLLKDTRLNDAFPPAPIPNAYWATPTLLACEYPWCPASAAASASASATASSNGATTTTTTIVAPKLTALLRAGIRTFIDLTEPHELLPYSPLLPSLCLSLGIPPSSVAYYRFPTKDRTPPSASTLDNVLGLLARLDLLKGGAKAAVHCRGGAGRTGTVVALYLLESGYAYALSLEQVGDDEESRRRQRQQRRNQNHELRRERNEDGGNKYKYTSEAKRAALAHVQKGWESTEKCVRLGYLRSPETEGQRRVVEGWEGVGAALAAEEAASAAAVVVPTTTTAAAVTVAGAATAAAAAAVVAA